MNEQAERAIAIVGLGAILPDAPDVATFWNNILNRRYSISEVPAGRWSIADYYDPNPAAPDKSYSKIGGWVSDFQFDWKRFRIPPKVAAAMDEGQQWAVTIAAEALADYGYPQRPLDTERTAVILGTAMGGERHYTTTQRIMLPEYRHALERVESFDQLPAGTKTAILAAWQANIDQAIPPITEDSMPGELPNIVSGRVANVLNLRGPNFITDAACASSFAAIEAAAQLLIEGKVDAAISGGVDRNMGISSFVKFCKIGALSATGTRPFGDGADGFVMGEGAAAFLLKRLSDAERDGDKIYAVIRGVGGASDGKGKGITAPNPIGQQLAMRRAWENATLEPATASLIEAHGTSTKVGDVVEVESLTTIFGAAGRQTIALGSVKSNIGHLKAGAGAAGLLKSALALHHKILPPTLNAQKPNPNIDFDHSPFRLSHQTAEWQPTNGNPRRAGVSAYGFGGTNFHLVLEEHQPGRLTQQSRQFVAAKPTPAGPPPPLRGILALSASTPAGLKNRLDDTAYQAETGWTPPIALPKATDLQEPERLVIDFADHDDLLEKLHKAQKVMGFDSPQAWKAVQAQGIFRGSGSRPGKIAFLFPGQGSQYINMGRELAARSSIMAAVLAEANQVMTPILGRPLTSYIYLDDEAEKGQAELSLMQTAITQPAMLTLDEGLRRLLAAYGFRPDMVMGHSLGEYAALVAAGVMPFAQALEAAAARGSEMTKVSVADNGKMAAVLAPLDIVSQTLQEVGGYVVPANINSYGQCVIGGASQDVERAIDRFTEKGYRALPLPVSHAFHTQIVAPASQPLRQLLNRLDIQPPQLPLIGNLTGDFYPAGVEQIKDMLQQQIASPVQWVKGLEKLYDSGVRTFIEVGPKKALKGFVDDVLANKADVLSLFTNHPKTGEFASFNQALCGLYAAGYGFELPQPTPPPQAEVVMMPPPSPTATAGPADMLSQLLTQLLQHTPKPATPNYRLDVPAGSVVITGSGLGLPGAEKQIMAEDNALRILRGEQFVDLIPERFRKRILQKQVTRIVKGEDGSGRFETITNPDEVIKLAGRPGQFDLSKEYGVPEKLVEALDITTQLAMAAGLDALREAGIPLLMSYKRTTTGKFLPDRWQLPESLRDETGIIFASAFPGGDRFADELNRYHTHQNRLDQLEALEDLRRYSRDETTLAEIERRATNLRDELARQPYLFDRRFLFRILAMGHSQFAEYIGARGPNTQVNAACASTTQAIALAEDWIRSGRSRRVIVIAADDVTSDNMMEWVGAGFLATGAAATDDRVEEAALPFDRRRHGTLMGMGACALVLESEDAVRERGMRGIVELLSSETRNSAFHGTRLNVDHIAQVMNDLLTTAEHRFGLNRQQMAGQMVFMSHETFTPARGGSAAAEVVALRKTFGEGANEIVVANTKGFTGHPMGVGIEDVIALKILEYGLVPPVPNYREVDPDLGTLNLSRGGRYPVHYALHLAAGFGSQIAMSLTRRIPGSPGRVDNPLLYQRWLDDISGYDRAETEIVKRVLRLKADGPPQRSPAGSQWQYGLGPTLRVANDKQQVVNSRLQLEPQSQPTSHQWQVEEKLAGTNGKPTVTEPASPPPPMPAETIQVAKGNEPGKGQLASSTPQPTEPSQPTAHSPEPITQKVLAIVAEQTGYPPEMLEPDLDLEADLGVDTVKQAETFAAIRAAFDIPRQDNLKLRDYPTLNHVIGFVRTMRPELAEAPKTKGQEQVPEPPQPTAHNPERITQKVLAIVAEQTGYPPEMLEPDLDLEADLGVDTVKQAETFAAIRAAFDIPRQDNLKLRDYPTLNHVIGFVRTMRPELAEAAKTKGQEQVPEPPQPTAHNPERITQKVLAIVAEQTGYPPEMLEPDLDLEADLGVDTVKQAETFAAIRAAFDIPRQDNLKLRDYPTLNHVIGFVRTMRPELAEAPKTNGPEANGQEQVKISPQPATLDSSLLTLPSPLSTPRRLPVAMLRPGLALCKSTGVTLDEQSRVVIMADQGGVSAALTTALEGRGVTVLTLTESDVVKQLQNWLTTGPIQGVYWLAALDIEPAVDDLDLASWRELNRLRVKNLSLAMRILYGEVNRPGTFLVTATRMGGQHGYDPAGATAPLGGAVTGFSKAYKREQPAVLVKTIDFSSDPDPVKLATTLIDETLADPGLVEVGYWQNQRLTISLAESPAGESPAGIRLNRDTVFLVTGAAGGITSAIIGDLATASGGTFHLLDLVAAPPANDPHLTLFRTNKEALKQALIAELKATGQKPTPVMVDKQLLAIERQEAARRAIETVEAAGGVAHYHSLNLLDGPAVANVVQQIRQEHGRIDVLIHAGGLEISRSLPDKEPAQFDLVFDSKADGFFNLLRAAKGMAIGASVVFSSVAGRFGNSGQCDYSAANDLLCKLTSNLRRWRPETQAIAIDWTAWGQIGMATRGSIPKIMEMAGIDMLSPAEGIPVVRRELLTGFQGEVVIANRLGMMMAEFDPTGGLDLEKANGWLAEQQPPLLMVGKLTAARLYGGLEVETRLDPAVQPFLYDHALDGTPLLPGVMGTETFTQLATVLANGYQVVAVEKEQFLAAFKFYRMEPQTLYLTVITRPEADNSLLAETMLRSVRPPAKEGLPAQEKIHFVAHVRLSQQPRQSPPPLTWQNGGQEIDQAAIYRIYFHGPAYKVLDWAKVNEEQAIGRLAPDLPANSNPAGAAERFLPRLIELCFQTAGVWEMVRKGVLALPMAIERVTVYARPEPNQPLYALVQAVNEGQQFNAQVVDESGRVYLDLNGYRTVQLPGTVKI